MIKTLDDIRKVFTPVPSKSLTEEMKARITRLELKCVEFAHEVLDLVPDCADRTAAFRKLMELKFTAVQAITHWEQEVKEATREGSKDAKQKGR